MSTFPLFPHSDSYWARVSRALDKVAVSFSFANLIGPPEGPENRTSREGWAQVWRRVAPTMICPDTMLLNHACRLRAAWLEGDESEFSYLLVGVAAS